jgi:hypothetical protein
MLNSSPSSRKNLETLALAVSEAKRRGLTVPALSAKEFEKDADDPIGWIEKHFRIPETSDKRLRLEPYQKEALTEALSKDENGLYKYSIIIWSDIKKSIKSTITAAVMLYRAWHTPWGQFTLVANDLKGADSRVGFYIRRAIELNPDMKPLCKVVNYRITLPNRAFIESVPIDPSGEAGGNADMVVFSELWGAHQVAQQRMWTEATIPPNKHGKAFRMVESYAGFSGESTLLEQLHETGVKHGERFEFASKYDPPLEVFHNDAARMFCLWNTTPRMPWQTPEYYASESAILLPNEFLRVHRNQWVSSTDTFVPVEWWDRCKANIKPIDKRQSMILILDAAVTGDTFGLMGITAGDIEGEYDIKIARRWIPPPKGRIDFDEVENEVRRLCDEYNVIEVCIDEYQLAQMAERLERDLVANVYRFPQGKQRTIADKRLQDAIRDRKIHHDGNPDLREHVQNANAKAAEDNKLRIVKRADHLKIDLCVCASMGLDRVVSWNL